MIRTGSNTKGYAMTPKIIKKNTLEKTIKRWLKSYNVIAPTTSKEGIRFRRITDPKEIVLNGDRNSVYPPKSVFLPQSEVMFNYEDGSYTMPETRPERGSFSACVHAMLALFGF